MKPRTIKEALGQGRGLLDSPCQHEPFVDVHGAPVEVHLGTDLSMTLGVSSFYICKRCRCVYATDEALFELNVNPNQ